MEKITKSHSKVIDQRDLILPPSWIGNKEQIEPATEFHNYDQVFISGSDRALSKKVISILDSAKEMAVICSFLLADQEIEDAIIDSAKRGVRIYLMLASETRLDKEPGEDHFSQKVLAQHKSMLKRLGGKVLIRSAPHFHAKVILADPYTVDAKGFLLTANLTKEAIERNEELGVELTSNEIKETVVYLRWAIWESSDHEVLDSNNFNSVSPLNCVDYPDAENTNIFFTSPKSTALKSKLLEVIGKSQSKIIITSFGWEKHHEVVTELCNKAKQGIEVTVLARPRNSAMPALIQLQSAGVKVLGYKWLHVKSIWTDQNEALVMSANIEKHGLDTGFEIGVFLTDERQVLVLEALKHWISKAQIMLLNNPKIGEVDGQIKVWRNSSLDDVTVSRELTHKLKTFDVPNEQAIDLEPKFPSPDYIEYPCHQVKYEWLNLVSKDKAKKNTKGLDQSDQKKGLKFELIS